MEKVNKSIFTPDNEWIYCPLESALVDENYRLVREMLNMQDIQGNQEFLQELAKNIGDPGFRQKHQIESKVAMGIYCVCENLLRLMCSEIVYSYKD